MAEWLCSGLQIRLRRFDSDPSLQNLARVVELVDTQDLKSCALLGVPVQVRPWAPLLS